MPTQQRVRRPAMYNTPAIRNGGFGALQVEAITNRPLSIARRHLAASQLRMRDIEPDELSSSEWVRFLAMERMERDRWMTNFVRRRRNSDESHTSVEADRDVDTSKAAEARAEAQDARRREAVEGSSMDAGTTPAVSLWVRQLDADSHAAATDAEPQFTARRPMHTRRAVTEAVAPDAPPTYDTVIRAGTPPPAYEPRSDDDESPPSPRQVQRSFHRP